jgi:DnaJ homolog subfamily A member 5
MSPLTHCHYEVLGIPQTADESEIKKAYRAAALASHPDRNRGTEDAAAERFKEVNQAYEILVDPHRRSWYDSHRDAILRDREPGASTDGSTSDLDLFSYCSSTAFSGFDDSPNSFFAVYSEVFSTLAAEERQGGVSFSNPSFGCPSTEWADVRKFYQAWDTFSSGKPFASADKWNLSEGPNRDYRRAMERENKRERAKAKKEYSLLVRELVAFLKKRDPRVKARKEIEAQENIELEKLAKEKQIRDKAQREEAAAFMRAQRDELLDEDGDALDDILAQLAFDEDLESPTSRRRGRGRRRKRDLAENAGFADNEENAENEENASEELDCPHTPNKSRDHTNCNDTEANSPEEFCNPGNTPKVEPSGDEQNANEANDQVSDLEDNFYCVACHKAFRSQAQKVNHESSRKHLTAARKLRSRLEAEDNLMKSDLRGEVETSNPEGLDAEMDSADNVERVNEAISAVEPGIAGNTCGKKQKKKRENCFTFNSVTSVNGEDVAAEAEPDIDKQETALLKPPAVNSEYVHASASEISDQSPRTGKGTKVERRMKRKEKRGEKSGSTAPSGSGQQKNDLRCNVCSTVFPSRNKLMAHISVVGHASSVV